VDTSVIFSIIGAAVALGGICVAFGVLKAKIHENEKEVELKAAKTELAAAIEHSGALLEIIQARVEEDRRQGEGRFKELYGIIGMHRERISKLEISQEQIFKMLDRLEITISDGFRDVRQDMKELQKALKQE
jgi:hypothetical protein